MILGLCGLKQSGKDTAAAYLMKTHGFERRAFADPLKRSLAVMLGIPFNEIDQLKVNDKISIAVGRLSESNYLQPHYKPLTFRELMQRYGTESHRDIFGEDFWVDRTLPNDPPRYIGRNVVITDCRFRNEADRIWGLGGKIVKITRPLIDKDRTGQADPDLHPSEVLTFAPNVEIVNNGTLDHFYQLIEDTLGKLLVGQSVRVA